MVNNELEIKREKTYAAGYNAMTYVIYAVELKSVQIDKTLRSKRVCKQLNSLLITYVSFRHSPKDFMLKQLHWTQLNNRPVRFERLNNVSVHQLVKSSNSDKVSSLRHNLLMILTLAIHPLFVGVEQTKAGKYEGDVFLLFLPSINIIGGWTSRRCW